MASLINYNDGLRRIEFAWAQNGPVQVVRLGRVNAKTAKSIKGRVEQLIADKQLNRPHDPDTVAWLAGVDEKLLSRLRKVGLADGVGVMQTPLGPFLDRVKRAQQVKPGTATFYGHTRRNLLACFGADRLLSDITEADADAFRAWLADPEKGNLAPATVSRRIIAARTFWTMAVRWKLVSANPFDGVRAGTQQNPGRQYFVAKKTIDQILQACPDFEWRALIGLARYGGLRVPSEALALKWEHINWDNGTMLVHASKTAHHDGKATRLVPLFPELRALLLDAFETAEDGALHVIGRYRDKKQNLRTQFERIIKRAGVNPWPRLWQNLRASRETELMRDYDLATVCRWIGNSPAVAAKHYAMSTDLSADLRRAAGIDAKDQDPKQAQEKAQEKTQETASASSCQALTDALRKRDKPLKNNASDNISPSRTTAVKGVEWAWQDSNLRPHPYQGCALTS